MSTIKDSFGSQETAVPSPHRAVPASGKPNTSAHVSKTNSVSTGSSELPVLDPAHPRACAREFLERTEGYRTLRHHNGNWYALSGPRSAYVELESAGVRAALYRFLEWSVVSCGTKDNPKFEPFKPGLGIVNAVLDALRSLVHLPAAHQPPCWLPHATHRCRSTWNPHDVIAVANGLVHLPTRALIPATPDFFTTNQLPYPFDPQAPPPTQFLRFLDTVWPDDPASRDLLQEVVGYLLSGDTRLQKLFLLVGPPRSGKGTIGHLLRALIGETNTCAPSLSNLSETFGLQQFIDKSLATVPDGRLGSRQNVAQLLERLLSISGGDVVSVQRKHTTDWTGALRARVVIISNDLPRIRDISGALASRFVPVVFTQSFLGNEDLTLVDRLLTELSSVLNWGLDGRDRLVERGRFVLPGASREALSQIAELSSPVAGFVQDCCEVVEGATARQDATYAAWTEWCGRHGCKPGTSQSFARNLRAVVLGLTVARPRLGLRQVRCWQGLRLLPPLPPEGIGLGDVEEESNLSRD